MHQHTEAVCPATQFARRIADIESLSEKGVSGLIEGTSAVATVAKTLDLLGNSSAIR